MSLHPEWWAHSNLSFREDLNLDCIYTPGDFVPSRYQLIGRDDEKKTTFVGNAMNDLSDTDAKTLLDRVVLYGEPKGSSLGDRNKGVFLSMVSLFDFCPEMN